MNSKCNSRRTRRAEWPDRRFDWTPFDPGVGGASCRAKSSGQVSVGFDRGRGRWPTEPTVGFYPTAHPPEPVQSVRGHLTLMAPVSSQLVEKQVAMDQRKGKMEDEMIGHMMQPIGMGKDSMAPCPMMTPQRTTARRTDG